MSTTPALNPYLKTKVLTASPVELRLLLFDGALRFLNQGMTGLENKDYEQVYEGFSQCQAIVLELINSLRPEHDPDLCDKLNGLYTFIYLQLVKAASERDMAVAKDVKRLLEYERETWQLLIEKLQNENNDGAASAAHVAEKMGAVPAPPHAPVPPSDGANDLVSGRISISG